MAGLQFNKVGFDQTRKYAVIWWTETTELKLVKHKASCTVILSPMVLGLLVGFPIIHLIEG